MRIISGKYKGRRFYPPADKWPTRPTTDYAKEGLFNILMNRLDFSETVVCDLFGGTGNHTYEFVSRGCEDVTYVDKHGPAVRFVRKTLALLNETDYVHIFQMDVFQFIQQNKRLFDYVFAGPPYGLETIDLIPDMIRKQQMLTPEGLFVLEHNANHDFENDPDCIDVRNYGGTIFSFFKFES